MGKSVDMIKRLDSVTGNEFWDECSRDDEGNVLSSMSTFVNMVSMLEAVITGDSCNNLPYSAKFDRMKEAIKEAIEEARDGR